jgi:hypothetical protein
MERVKRGILFLSDFSQNFSFPFFPFFLKNIFFGKISFKGSRGSISGLTEGGREEYPVGFLGRGL